MVETPPGPPANRDEEGPPSGTQVDLSSMVLAMYGATSTQFLTNLVIAIAALAPQIALLALLMVTNIRVGTFLPAAAVIAISDVVTLYFGAMAFMENFAVHRLERVSRRFMGRPKFDSEPPTVMLALQRLREWTFPKSNWGMALVLTILIAFVGTVSFFVVWLWFNP
jgi:hypothetical protein